MSYFLGVDLGGTVIKAGIYNPAGEEVAVCEHTANLLSEAEGFAERNMDEMWKAVCIVTGGAVKKAGIDKADIKGVSFSSHGKGLYAIDKAGNPVRNGIISSDTRSVDIVLKWLADGTADKAYPYGMQQIWTGHPVSLLSWLKQHERANYDKIAAILMVHDYVRFRMTGEIGAEITNISGSNMYNIQTGQYDPKLMSLFGVEECESKTAPIVGSSEECGKITAKAAEELGLAAGTPVFGGFFDVVSAAIASGVVDDTAISAAAGTWSIATAVSKSIPKKDHHYVWGRYCIPGLFFVHEGSPTSASNLSWWRDNVISHLSLDECNKYVDEVQKAFKKTSLFFLPYLFGSNYQIGMNANLYGLQAHHTIKDVVYAIYEGIVFSHTLNQDKILQITPNAKTIRMNGGPTNSEPWMRIYASTANMPIEISTVKQTGCKAAAICAAVGAGYYSDYYDAIKQTLQPMKIIEPDLKLNAYLRERYAEFLEINEKLAK